MREEEIVGHDKVLKLGQENFFFKLFFRWNPTHAVDAVDDFNDDDDDDNAVDDDDDDDEDPRKWASISKSSTESLYCWHIHTQKRSLSIALSRSKHAPTHPRTHIVPTHFRS